MAGVKTQLVIDGVNKAQPAFNQANRQFFALEGAAKKAGAAIAATLSVGVIAAWVKESIDAADAARKQAQAIGLTTEALTSLQWAASQSGVSTNDLSAAFGRLNRAAMDAATGSEKQAQLFAKLGVSVTDSEGALRSGDAILMDLADRFKQLPDGVEKSALAMELFGRSGAKLIPMLNAGSDGLTQLREEAERLGLVINDQQAQEAEQFNDSISALGAQSKGAANIVSGELLPTLNTMVGLLGETASAGEATTIAANFLSGALKLLATAGIISGAQLRVVGKGLGALAAAAMGQTSCTSSTDCKFPGSQKVGLPIQRPICRQRRATLARSISALAATRSKCSQTRARLISCAWQLASTDGHIGDDTRLRLLPGTKGTVTPAATLRG